MDRKRLLSTQIKPLLPYIYVERAYDISLQGNWRYVTHLSTANLLGKGGHVGVEEFAEHQAAGILVPLTVDRL